MSTNGSAITGREKKGNNTLKGIVIIHISFEVLCREAMGIGSELEVPKTLILEMKKKELEL